MLIAHVHLITTLLLGGLVLGYHLIAFFMGKSISFWDNSFEEVV
jgi:hypothetical protein